MSAQARAASLSDEVLDQVRLELATCVPDKGTTGTLTRGAVRAALWIVMGELERRGDERSRLQAIAEGRDE